MTTQPRIGLVTLDMRFASAVKSVAADFGARVIHVSDPAELPLDVNVIISRRGEGFELTRGQALYMEDFDSVEELVERAVELYLVGSSYRTAIAAVDPGKNIGAVFLVDNKVVKTRRYGLAEDLVKDVERFMRSHRDAEKRYVVIGAASDIRIVDEILSSLERALSGEGVALIVSDESFTSKGVIPRLKSMSRDEYSALMLSIRNLLKLR